MRRVVRISFVMLMLGVPARARPQESTRDHFFSSAGVRIRYLDQGHGDAIILLHGYAGSADAHWVKPGVFDRLAADHRVIALDLRGHGKSDKPHDPAAYGPELGKDILRLMNCLGLPRVHLVGYSLGAGVAAQLAAANPGRFATLTLIASGSYRTWTSEDDVAAERAARELESDSPFRSLVLTVSPVDAPLPTEERILDVSRALAAANDVHALAALNRGRRGMITPDSALASIAVPVLGIVGGADRDLVAMQQLGAVLHDYHLVVVDSAAHGGDRGVLRRPEAILALQRFVGGSPPVRDASRWSRERSCSG
jgi:pimeloyl-ACP methyl ester carboxylesterase